MFGGGSFRVLFVGRRRSGGESGREETAGCWMGGLFVACWALGRWAGMCKGNHYKAESGGGQHVSA